MSKLYRTWTNRVDSWTRGDARPEYAQILRYRDIYAHALDGFPYCSLSDDEAADLVARVERGGPYGLTDEHTRKGIDWLKSKARQLAREGIADVGPILDTFDRFTWSGALHLVDCGTHWRPPTYAPVWTIHTTDGRAIDYAATPWQAGGIVEIWRPSAEYFVVAVDR